MPLQDWEPTVSIADPGGDPSVINTAITEITYDATSQVMSGVSPILFKVKDIIGVSEYASYSDFRLVTTLYFESDSGAIVPNWLQPACYQHIGIAMNNGVDPYNSFSITENGMTFNFDPTFQNLETLPNGIYNFFQIFLINASPDNSTLEAYQHILRLTVTNFQTLPVLTIPYLDNQKAFTLDPKFIELTAFNPDNYYQLNIQIKTYDFSTDVEYQYQIPEKIVLFKNKSKINIGQIIHRLMRKFLEPYIGYQYKYTIVKLVCVEKKISDNSVVRSEESNEIQFIAGLSRGITDIGFLDFNLKPNRVTINSFIVLNIIIPDDGIYILNTYRNETLIAAQSLVGSEGQVTAIKRTFQDYNQGDKIDFTLTESNTTNPDAPKKSYIIFPEGKYSNTIIWENEFLVQSVLECTGTVQIKSDFEFQSQKAYNLVVETLNYLSSTSDIKVIINTGWLLKTDIDTIVSLMRTKRAWLSNNGQLIQLRPISKSIINEDTERELIEFTLEFVINKTYDEETFTL